MPLWRGDGFLLTDTGGCRIGRADRIGDPPGGLTLLTPEVKPWVSLWPKQLPGPGDQVAYEVVVSRRWGFADGDSRAIVMRRQRAGMDFESFTVAPTSDAPGLRADPAAQRLDAGPLRGFQPRLWFPGVDEYVVGERPAGLRRRCPSYSPFPTRACPPSGPAVGSEFSRRD